jgi:hypothetical protein
MLPMLIPKKLIFWEVINGKAQRNFVPVKGWLQEASFDQPSFVG